jgi:plastocyanin
MHARKPRSSAAVLRTFLSALLTLAVFAVVTAPAKTAPVSTVVTLNLTRYSKVAQLDAGDYVGVSPGRVVVHVGDQIVFVNNDTRHHTATLLLEAKEFPQDPHWTESAQRSSGKIGAEVWSTGDIAPGARSAPLLVTKPGIYLYGCFYHYTAGMRGEIVVEP